MAASSFLVLALALALVAVVTDATLRFRRHLGACRASGIAYVVVPFLPHGLVARLTAPLWRPLLRLVPGDGAWRLFMNPDMLWDELYTPFRRVGADTVLVCAPEAVLLFTAEASVIHQVTDRRGDFPKAVALYSIIDIYGKSAISVEGALWRKHRRAIAAPFHDRNTRAVWAASLVQAEQLLAAAADDKDAAPDMEALPARVALAIISQAGFGVQLGARDAWAQGRTGGHRMAYADAIFSVAADVLWLLALPRGLLRFTPWAAARRVGQAYIDWGQYMREMIAAKQDEVDDAASDVRRDDLLATLVRAAAPDGAAAVADATTGSGTIGLEGFSHDEIMGNAFLLIMAGYETTAGNLQAALTLLAMNVDAQRALQHDIDAHGGRPAEWNYDQDFPRAWDGMLGAVMAETLRWMPPVLAIPKWAPAAASLVVGGATCTVPAGAHIALHIPAAHRNPHQWPRAPPRRPDAVEHAGSNPDDDLGEFRPARWLEMGEDVAGAMTADLKAGGMHATARGTVTTEGTERTMHAAKAYASGTAPGLYRPPRGAYLPFSEGGRACAGRRFAQVEVIAILAVIFQAYSVELDVRAWCSDAEIARLPMPHRRDVWRQARATAQHQFRTGTRNLMTNRLVEAIPLRFVRRGAERFAAEDW